MNRLAKPRVAQYETTVHLHSFASNLGLMTHGSRRLFLPFLAASILIALLATPARSNAGPCTVDTGFNPPLNVGAQVYAVALQTNGQILIGGQFSSIGGTNVANIARLNADGRLDPNFDPGTAADIGYVSAIAVQPDGKVVIGGSFFSSTSAAPGNLARLNADGSVDPGFDPGFYCDNAVNAVVVQPDGKILFGGAFQTVDSFVRRNIARVQTNGTVDAMFDACVASSSGAGATGLVLLPEEEILASGTFTFTVGVSREGIALLGGCMAGMCGNVETNYAPQPGMDANKSAYAVARRSNGNALLAGDFRFYHNEARGGIVELTTNGVPASSFNPGVGINDGATIYTMAIQDDDRVIVGGNFVFYNGQLRYRFARINPDGSLDGSFDPGTGANDSVSAIVLQPDRKILVAGKFSSFNGATRKGIVRLYGDHLAAQLGTPSRLGNGQVQFSLTSDFPATYAVQASSNLVNWVAVTNVTLTNSSTTVTDAGAGALAKRYYRAVSVP